MASLTSLIFSLSFLDILTLLGTLILLYIVKFYISYFTRANALPGPIPLPLIGNLVQMSLAGDVNKWALAAQAKYGDIWEIYIGSEKQIWFARADLIEKLMSASKNNKYFVRNPPSSGLDLIGLSSRGTLFNRDKDKWYLNRKIFAQTLTTAKFSKLATKWTQQVFANMEGYFTELGYDEKAFNFAKWMPRVTADITFLVSMSKHGYTLASLYNSYNPSKPAPYPQEKVIEAENLVLAVQKYASTINFFLMTPEIIRTMTPYGNQQTKMHLNNLAWLRDTLLAIIREKREEIKDIEKSQLTPDFLTLLVTVNTPKDITQQLGHNTIEEPLIDDDIRGSLTEMVAAGIDTTANSICFIVYQVLKHPRVKERLRQELDAVLGTDLSAPIKYEDLSKLVYTDAVIKETARLLPVNPITLRASEEDDVIGGHHIKKDVQLIVCSLGIHHHSKHWDDPEVYNPDRFLEPNNSNIERHAFTPFGGGVRICPGRQLAMTELRILTAKIFHKYDPELAEPDAEPKYRFEAVNYCYELMLRFKPRKIAQ